MTTANNNSSTSMNEYYASLQSTLESLKPDEDSDLTLWDYVAEDMDSGPTLTAAGGGGDYEADAHNIHYSSDKQVGLPTQRVDVISRGLLTLGENATDIDMYDYTTYSCYRPKTNVQQTDWWLYSGVDASAATGKVTFQGLDESVWGTQWHGRGSNGDSGTASDAYIPGYVKTEYTAKNYFKGGDHGNLVYGGHGNDVLIGGAGDDEIHGIGGDNKIYGVGGDNQLFGGNGNDIIFGGSGNDFINTGAGNNNVVLGHGDNWVVVPQNSNGGDSNTTYANKLVAGTGTDTFVIGNIPAPETTTTSDFSGIAGGILSGTDVDVAHNIVDVGMDLFSVNPLIGFMADNYFSVLATLTGGKTSVTTEWPTFQTSYIYEYNPLNDRILLPMSADGDLSYKITGSTSSADDWALEFYDHNAKDGSPFLRVDFADAQTIFGDWTSGELSSPEIQGFTEAFLQNCFIMDTDNVKFGTHKLSLKDLDLASSINTDLGDGGFLFGGAWSGNFLSGNIDGDYYMGTNHDDVLFGFDITGSTLEPKTGGGLKFFGFGGDNLFGTGDGKNVVYGGDGNNTVTYQYGDMAIYADMTDKATHPTNSKGYGDYYEIHQGTSDSIVDYDTLYNVQNIVGSRFDDVLTGDQKDNTFYSTGGANTWTGTGGANTFFLNGGSAEITDYTESDTIKVDNSVYQTKGANMSWIEAEGSWALYDSKSDSNIVTLDKTDGFEAPSEFTMIWKDGTEHIKTVDVQYMELLAA